MRSTEDESEEESSEDGGSLSNDRFSSASEHDGLTLLSDPEGVELPDHSVVEAELGVVGKVVGGLPLGDDGVLEGGVFVSQAAAANRVAIDGLDLGDVGRVIGQELADGLLGPGISGLDEESFEVVVGREGLEGDGQLFSGVDDALAGGERVARRSDLSLDVVAGSHRVTGDHRSSGLIAVSDGDKQRQVNHQHCVNQNIFIFSLRGDHLTN